MKSRVHLTYKTKYRVANWLPTTARDDTFAGRQTGDRRRIAAPSVVGWRSFAPGHDDTLSTR